MRPAEVGMPTDQEEIFSSRTQKTLREITPDCKQLLMWKHIEGLSHDEIAERKNIKQKLLYKNGKQLWKAFP